MTGGGAGDSAPGEKQRAARERLVTVVHEKLMASEREGYRQVDTARHIVNVLLSPDALALVLAAADLSGDVRAMIDNFRGMKQERDDAEAERDRLRTAVEGILCYCDAEWSPTTVAREVVHMCQNALREEAGDGDS